MAILSCPAQPAPPRFAPREFSSPHKGGGAGMGQDFSPASWGWARMGLDPPRPASPHPCPALLKIVIVNFNTLKPYYLNKHININLFYSTQYGSLPLFCHVLYYEIFSFFLSFFFFFFYFFIL